MRPFRIRVVWTPAFGLVALLALTATSCRQHRGLPGPARKEQPIEPTPPVNLLRVAVSADAAITVGGEGSTVEPQALLSRLTGPNSTRPIELRIDPRAAGKTVDDLLDRLSRAGVSRLSLVIDPPAQGASIPVASRTAQPKVDTSSEADLEVPVIEVRSRSDGVSYRIGNREAGAAGELQRLLEPLAQLGRTISVRISHDGPFAHSAAAIAACRDAGFTTILLVTGASGP